MSEWIIYVSSMYIAVCLCHNQNYAQDLRQAMPLPTMLITVKYVNYIASGTSHILSANITAHSGQVKQFLLGFCHKHNLLKQELRQETRAYVPGSLSLVTWWNLLRSLVML